MSTAASQEFQEQTQAARDLVQRIARSALRPDPLMTISEWADQNRVLTSRSSPEPGLWRTSRVPYLKAVMDALSPSDRCEIVVLMSGAQVGKTEAGNNWIGYTIDKAPGPFMAVQPTVDMALRNSKQRIAPLIEDCPVLRHLVKESRSRDSGNTLLSKEFPGGILVMTGANSAKGLRSMSARYLFMDEVDGYKGDVDGEGEPCELAMARTANYARRKILITSTPTLSGRSRIERYFNLSDQNHFYVPCPFCMEYQELRPENFRYPAANPKAASFGCVTCGRELLDHMKNFMLPRGEWRPHGDYNGLVKGFYLPSFYSPVGWKSWGQIASQHAASEGDPIKRQVYHNLVLGLPWADQGEVPDENRLFERREDYAMGQVPEGGLVLTAGVDVQMKRLEVEIVAWGRNRVSWSVDYRVLEGDTTQPQVWKELEQLLDQEFPTAYGQPLRIERTAIDSGFQPMTVYDFARDMLSSRVMVIKGNNTSSTLTNHPTLIEHGPQGQRLKAGVRVWPINVSIGKEQLYRWLKQSMPDLEKHEPWPVGYCHFPMYSKEFFEQLCAEQLITRVLHGIRRTVWEKRRERNEALDCRVYAMAAASALRVEVWAPQKWDDIERSLTIVRAPGAAAKPVAKPRFGRSAMPQFKPFGSNDRFTED